MKSNIDAKCASTSLAVFKLLIRNALQTCLLAVEAAYVATSNSGDCLKSNSSKTRQYKNQQFLR
jgi:hypothetical protein